MLGTAVFSAGLMISACDDPGSGTTAGLDETETGADETETGEDETAGYGTVRIEVAPINGDASILAGTTEVEIVVNYEDCLQDFYLGNSDLTQDGQVGMPVFVAFLDKLCSDDEGTVACTIEDIRQNLIEANSIFNLTVTYVIQDPESIVGNEFRVGPLPTTELAGCPAQVELRQAGVVGRNEFGDQIWRISTLPASNVAVTDQGAPLLVEVVAL